MNYNTAFIAKPMSRKDIVTFANLFWNAAGWIPNKEPFPVMDFFENRLCEIDTEFYFEVRDKKAMRDVHALAVPEEHSIIVREDVYIGACKGRGRDRMTIMHEVFHYLHHDRESISSKDAIAAFARCENQRPIPLYMNPEWQADAFAGEVLIPRDIASAMSADEISETFLVSFEAARYAKTH